jgi:hypothetical protein
MPNWRRAVKCASPGIEGIAPQAQSWGCPGAVPGGAGLDDREQGGDGQRVKGGGLVEEGVGEVDGLVDDAEQRAVINAGSDPVDAAAEGVGTPITAAAGRAGRPARAGGRDGR